MAQKIIRSLAKSALFEALNSKLVQLLLTTLHPLAWVNIYEMLLYDLRWRVDSFGSVAANDIPGDMKNRDEATPYMPAFRSALNWGLAEILAHEKGFSHLNFLDCGSGKGKMCFLAESYARRCSGSVNGANAAGKWAQIEGVELNSRLVEIARRNGQKLASGAGFLAEDILSYRDLRSSSVIFAFNPFGARVMGELEKRLRIIPYVYFIYNNPLHADIFRNWTLISRRRSLIGNLKTNIYLSPATGSIPGEC